ncbi:hypothetical protein I4F81_003243 [Pyropia yezoensis]|uniref:Uncharacterized protein n=1 Tax=Pyropia yezoensis TaxID=2788 RepID=A0ACC3BRP6_PYRYE|nr:hypothetical protein I4F81_003243 [Neopyropia yezoensis]
MPTSMESSWSSSTTETPVEMPADTPTSVCSASGPSRVSRRDQDIRPRPGRASHPWRSPLTTVAADARSACAAGASVDCSWHRPPSPVTGRRRVRGGAPPPPPPPPPLLVPAGGRLSPSHLPSALSPSTSAVSPAWPPPPLTVLPLTRPPAPTTRGRCGTARDGRQRSRRRWRLRRRCPPPRRPLRISVVVVPVLLSHPRVGPRRRRWCFTRTSAQWSGPSGRLPGVPVRQRPRPRRRPLRRRQQSARRPTLPPSAQRWCTCRFRCRQVFRPLAA